MVSGVNPDQKPVFLSEKDSTGNLAQLAALKAWSFHANVGTQAAFKQLCRFNADPATLRAATVDSALSTFAGGALLYFFRDKISCLLFTNFMEDPSELLTCLGASSDENAGAALYRTAVLTCSAALVALGGYWVGRRLFTDTTQQKRYELLQGTYATAMRALDGIDDPEKKEEIARKILANLSLIETCLQDMYRMTPLQARKLGIILRTGCEAV